MISKRETIILISLLVLLIYSLYAIFIKSPHGSLLTKKLTETNKLIKETAGELMDTTESELVDHIVNQAESPWGKDPFVGKNFFLSTLIKTEDQDEKSISADNVKRLEIFTYSGYLDMGTRKLAVINNIEYMIGEKIDGYSIKYIDPGKVILKEIQTGEKKILRFENENGQTSENR